MIISQRFKLLFVLLLVACFTLGVPLAAYGADNSALAEVRELLRNDYVDPVPENVLSAPTIEEMLKRLGDPHTQYLTKEEYKQFINTLDRAFSGVGVELEVVPEGVLVTRAIEGYGAAKAGIKTGDIIYEADGKSLAGKTAEYCVSLLRGPEGSKVQLKVKRGSQNLAFAVERMLIEMPLVESEVLENHIGYIAVYSFGQDTVAEFAEHAKALKDKGVCCWIIDLRNNGGGYTQAALELLGYFIEDKSALILKDKSVSAISYNAVKQNFTLEGPIIFLTNRYTASSSEIVSAALKDHNKAFLLGEKTYGSGRVKALIPLSNGDYLKMTVNKFYSPLNKPIDNVGIAPHLELTGVDELQAAVFLLKDYKKEAVQAATKNKTGYLQIKAGDRFFVSSLQNLKKAEYWQAGRRILEKVKAEDLRLGGKDGWETIPKDYLKNLWELYYQGYIEAGNLPEIPLDKVFTLTFTKDMDWRSVSADKIELINSVTGERIDTKLTFVDKRVMTVTPKAKLQADTEYWLVIHPSIIDVAGKNIIGGVAIARTVK
ncbi:MAG TPA: PDZ domain-containing protein [Peptococcaceae bacterium]|nr:PDZ domain-containing protein [Peptococcaceae bacterium]